MTVSEAMAKVHLVHMVKFITKNGPSRLSCRVYGILKQYVSALSIPEVKVSGAENIVLRKLET